MSQQHRMNLRDWMESEGALRLGTRIAWASVEWELVEECEGQLLLRNAETMDVIDLGTAASLPAAGWRVVE